MIRRWIKNKRWMWRDRQEMFAKIRNQANEVNIITTKYIVTRDELVSMIQQEAKTAAKWKTAQKDYDEVDTRCVELQNELAALQRKHYGLGTPERKYA